MASAHPRERGFALIIVLWFLVLIGAIGIILILNARTETAIAHNIRAAADAEALADDGIARAAFRQLDPVEANRWRLDGAAHRIALPGGDVTIRLADETQKINPNLASQELLAGLFEAVGVDRGRARHLGAAIADWVGPDGPPRDMGAKLEQYRAAGKSYGPPNAPLETLDDLALVLGMTPDILSQVRPYLTIYSQSAEPNEKNAPPIIQRALAMAAQLTEDGADAPEAGASPPAAAAGSAAAPGSASASNNPQANPKEERLISVEAIGRSRDGGVYVRSAVLRLEPDNPQGYKVLDWQRGSLPAENAKVTG
jgi:general secretion pathway protein K